MERLTQWIKRMLESGRWESQGPATVAWALQEVASALRDVAAAIRDHGETKPPEEKP